nr:MAG TPA: hypothetical protein [Caudoviricetes sp.]
MSLPVRSICPKCEPHSFAVILTISSACIALSGNHFFFRFPILVLSFHSVSHSSSVSFSNANLSRAAAALGDCHAISFASL